MSRLRARCARIGKEGWELVEVLANNIATEMHSRLWKSRHRSSKERACLEHVAAPSARELVRLLLLSLLMQPQTLQWAPHGVAAMRTLAETCSIGNIVHESKIWICARKRVQEISCWSAFKRVRR